MFGLMQDHPLLISSLIEHAATFHPEAEIVSRLADGSLHRTHWRGVGEQARRLANALRALDIREGDRVATLAWNSHRHLALYFGISGIGAVLHTVNPRLLSEQIEYIVNHAGDRLLFFDLDGAALVQQLAPRLRTVERFVALCGHDELPPGLDLPGLLCCDDIAAAQEARIAWPALDERTASSLCYTSGTTGHPNGVLYSHRSTVLQALASLAPDALGLHAGDTLLLGAPMFHGNAWGVPHAAAMTGARLVLPGPRLDGRSLYTLMRDEQVTLSLGPPAVWTLLFEHLDADPGIDARQLALRRVVVGGAALPRPMLERFQKVFAAEVLQAWGMTETSPLGLINQRLPRLAGLAGEALTQVRLKQGRGVWGVALKIVDDAGQPLPWDGESVGRLRVRGPWVAAGYFKDGGGPALDAEGFLHTGDLATIDREGHLQMVDREEDVIRSGGEWISSVAIEEAALRHPGVAEAAAIAVSHPKWQERPLLLIVRRPGHDLDRQGVLDSLVWRMAKWWLPDDVVFVDRLPRTGTGKVQKALLRAQYRDHLLSKP
jgi:fatty-acyl-CoA synthase